MSNKVRKFLIIVFILLFIIVITAIIFITNNNNNYYYNKISQINKNYNLTLPATHNIEVLYNATGGFQNDGPQVIKLTYEVNQKLELNNTIQLNKSNSYFLLKIIKEYFPIDSEDNLMNINNLIQNNNISSYLIRNDIKNNMDLLILLFNPDENALYLFLVKY